MIETPPQTGPIAVYGATGYTGRLVPRLPKGPSEESRRRSRFMIVCDARADSQVARTLGGFGVEYEVE